MKFRSILVIAPLAGLLTVSMAQNTSPPELPSAPSAVIQQHQPKPAPAAVPSPAQVRSPAAPAPGNAAVPASSSAATREGSVTAAPGPSKKVSADEEDNAITTFRKRVDEVNVIFTVTDKHGRFVKNLTKENFKVLDDNRPAASVLSFRSETDLPLRVGLLVDASNSVRDRFKFEQESAIEFLNQIIRPRYDKAFVIGFDTTPELTQDFTDSTERLSRGVRLLRPGGGTALYDALYYACRDKLMKTEQTGPLRHAIILLSDGEDNQSRVTREEAIEMAERAEVIVYAISTNVSGVKLRGDKIMERIAEATGGRAFFPFKIQDVANAFSEIQDELRSQYALAYKPADFRPDGRYHAILIEAENHKNLHVRARRGYYAPLQ